MDLAGEFVPELSSMKSRTCIQGESPWLYPETQVKREKQGKARLSGIERPVINSRN